MNPGQLERLSEHLLKLRLFKSRERLEGLLQHAAALKPIYGAGSAAAAADRLQEFDPGPWGAKYPATAQNWRRNGE